MKFTGIYAAPPTLDAPLARIFFDWHDRRRTHSPRLMLDNDHMEALLARVALRDRKAFHERCAVSSSHLFAVTLRDTSFTRTGRRNLLPDIQVAFADKYQQPLWKVNVDSSDNGLRVPARRELAVADDNPVRSWLLRDGG